MDDANLKHAITVLEQCPEVGLPMIALHATIHRAGAAHLTLAALKQGLRHRDDLFAVIDPSPLPWDTGFWPPTAVAGYREAFNDIGFAADTFVVLRPDVAAGGLVGHLRATVIALRDGGAGRAAEAARLLLAANAASASWRSASRHDETTRPTSRLPHRGPPTRDRPRARRRRRRRLPSS
ncbi:MAG: hypothetical protein P8Z36_01205 [Gemmatimonadota bacterium]|jgi:hypothetical protein